jgi:hypothetical protein
MAGIPALWDRVNLGKWAVPACHTPAATAAMLSTPSLTYDPYDRQFRGQVQRTTYFDTPAFDLRQARKDGQRYCVLRIRCYEGADGEFYVLSAKTEDAKYRVEIEEDHAEQVLAGAADILNMVQEHLPGNVLARLGALVEGQPLRPVVCVSYRRYAVEDETNRLTLDVEVEADNGRCLHYGVLEFKSADRQADVPFSLEALPLRPVKFSKFLWATRC